MPELTAPSGRRPGSSGTREAILSAASRQFAHVGYDRASLRTIAAEAGVNQKLITHFFGSKQHLFVSAVGLPLNPTEMLTAVLAGDRDAVGKRLAELLTTLLDQPALHERLTGVLRAAASEPQVARMLREFLAREVFEPIGQRLGTEDAHFRANLVGSQIVGLVMARFIVGLEPLSSTAPELIAAAVAPTLEHYLLKPLTSPVAPMTKDRSRA